MGVRVSPKARARLKNAVGGNDPSHDLSDEEEEKDELEADLRRVARDLLARGKARDRRNKLARASEISREKSKRAHQGVD